MEFICNTKPLSDALNLGIINANVSNYFKKSSMAQITVTKNMLTINLEANHIVSEIKIKGAGNEDSSSTAFVSSLLLKQLVNTFESATTTIEFVEGGIVLHSGKSKFTLPNISSEAEDVSLATPKLPETILEEKDVVKNDWKFIADNQMFAIAMSFVSPVYTLVWMGDKDVLVGDFDNGVFTHSKKSCFSEPCMFFDTIINLLASLPEGAKICKVDRNYIVKVNTEGFEYVAEIHPEYEDGEFGEYNSEIILTTFDHSAGYISVDTSAVNKFLSQAAILSKSSEDSMNLEYNGTELIISDDNVNCKLSASGNCNSFNIEVKTALLKSAFSKYGEGAVNISPRVLDEDVVGIVLFNDELSTVIAGVDE